MTTVLTDAAQCLIDILETENTAIDNNAIANAIALLPEKRAAADRLSELVRTSTPREMPHSTLHAVFKRLETVSHENARLLECAITVQTNIVKLLLDVIQEPEDPVGYTRSGRHHHGANTARYQSPALSITTA